MRYGCFGHRTAGTFWGMCGFGDPMMNMVFLGTRWDPMGRLYLTHQLHGGNQSNPGSLCPLFGF